MRYYAPNDVISPKDCVSNIEVLYDGGEDSVSVAYLDWDGISHIAMRWNVAHREWKDSEKKKGKNDCVGMPSSRGYPVWFILPKELFDQQSDLRQAIENHLQKQNQHNFTNCI